MTRNLKKITILPVQVSLRLQVHPQTFNILNFPPSLTLLKHLKLISTQNTYVFSLCRMIKLYLRNHQKSFQQLLIQYYKDIILSIKILIRYIVWWVLICHYWLLRRGHTQHKNHMKYICLLYIREQVKKPPFSNFPQYGFINIGPA